MAQASALRSGQQPAEPKTKIAGAKVKPSYKHVPHSQKPPHLVAKRNARERRRVQAVNQAFYKLRKCVPIENRNKRVSKVKTLQRAIDYIRKLERILADEEEDSQQQQSVAGQVADSSAASADRRPTTARRTKKPTANCDQAAPVAADQPRLQTSAVRQRRSRRASPAACSQAVQAVGPELTPHCQTQPSEPAAYLAAGAQTEPAKFSPPAGSEPGYYCPAYPQQDEVLRESSAYNNSLNYFSSEQHYPAAGYAESQPPFELYGAAYSGGAGAGYLYAGYPTEQAYSAGEPDWQRGQQALSQQLAAHKSEPAASQVGPAASSFAPLRSPLSSASNSSSNSADSTGAESGPVCRQRASANSATLPNQQQQVNSYLPYATPLPARTLASRPAHLSFAQLAYQQLPAQQQQQQLDGHKESATASEPTANELREASAHHQVRHLLSGGQPNSGLSANSLHEQQHQYHQHHQHGQQQQQQQSFQSNQRQHHLNHPGLNHLNNGGQHSNNGLNAIRAPATLMQTTTTTTSTIQEYTTNLL